jgi:hypothetical protein
MKKIIPILVCLMLLGLVFVSYSRSIIIYSFDELTDKATVVVIATPTTVTATTNQCTFDGGNIMGTGVETSFRILGVFKGDRNIKELTLRYFARSTPESEMKNGVMIGYLDGPGLISFEPNSHKQYLMFLQKEADGRYVAVTGQEDPIYSVQQLKEDELQVLTGPITTMIDSGEQLKEDVNFNTGKPLNH